MYKLIQDSSNGSEWLKKEIKRSDNRIVQAKQGKSLDKIAPEHDI